MRKVLLAFGLLVAVLVALGAVVVARTFTLPSRQMAVAPVERLPLDEQGAAARLAGALRFQTVSRGRAEPSPTAELLALHDYLEAAFPLTHNTLEREVISDYSLLYTWHGGDRSLPPLLLTAHLDVVPVDPATVGEWTHPPFEGVIADGAVWGRGALDNKSGVVGILEAVERHVADGFQPQRSILIAFGHDEEIGGVEGASVIARTLHDRGVRPTMVVDEGGFISVGLVPVAARPVALVAVAEKGYLTLDLTVAGTGGHSSAPPRQTAIGILSAAIARLEERPFPARLEGATRVSYEYIAPELPFSSRAPLANLWLFRPFVERRLAEEPAGAAGLRTTTAATMINGGVKDNVLPRQVQATVNFRIKTGESVASVIERVTSTINDERVQISVRDGMAIEPSPVSPVDGDAFALLQRTVHEILPDAMVAPFTTFGATDARYYTSISPNVYRFLPVRLRQGELVSIHGVNEMVRISDYADAIRFFHRLIAAGGAP